MNTQNRILVFDTATQERLTAYIRRLFAQEDDLLSEVHRRTNELGLPEIHIRPEEGKILQFLAMLIGARTVVELGTLAGYSTIWLARSLPEGGRLITLEAEPRHAQIAREHFERAGLSDRIELIEGNAVATLQNLRARGPFDMVFIDADKQRYPDYLSWSVANVRPGGLIVGHNAFRQGRLVAPEAEWDDATIATHSMLAAMSQDERLFSTIIPVGDGFAVAQVRG
ncbi:MAG: O-methyltransferase [Chloroflexi bacterium]|nr:O-methyltransferase [Chloroflexota bacterium]